MNEFDLECMNVCVRERNKMKQLWAKIEDRAVDVARENMSSWCMEEEECVDDIGYSQSWNRMWRKIAQEKIQLSVSHKVLWHWAIIWISGIVREGR